MGWGLCWDGEGTPILDQGQTPVHQHQDTVRHPQALGASFQVDWGQGLPLQES